jgi:hypothetical protein
MIGLGVLATGSGAAALTGASLANTVSPAADFRVNVDSADLVVERGPANYDGTETLSDGSNGGGLYIDGAASSALDDIRDLAVAANSGTNDNLDFGTLIPRASLGTGSSFTADFPEALKITNNSGSTLPVGITYGKTVNQTSDVLGSVDTTDVVGYSNDATKASQTATVTKPLVTEAGNASDQISFDQAADVFNFFVQDDGGTNTRISPLGNTSDENNVQIPHNVMQLQANSSVSVSLQINITGDIMNKIVEYIDNSESITGGSFSIIDQMFVGEASSFSSGGTSTFTPSTL